MRLGRLLIFGFLILALFPLNARAAGAVGAAFHVSPDLHELLSLPEEGRAMEVLVITLQLAAVLFAAKLMGWLAERLRVPGVVGELLAGAIIGPFLLGQWIKLPLHGVSVPLFPRPINGQWPVNDVLWSFAQFASIVLLFVTGLHTDLKQFLRYVGPASLVAVAGILAPFALGTGTVYLPMFADLARPEPGASLLVPALFVGAVLAATSIGITARVLGDIDKLDTPEGVTILGAAVVDDVLGIIALAVVGGIASAGGETSAGIAWGKIAIIAGKAFGVWIGLTVVVLLLARPIERAMGLVRYSGATLGIGLALAFLCSGIAEFFGLAFIIGAYSVGLGLSRTKMASHLLSELRPIYEFVVPIFFAVLGMMVDFGAIFSGWRIVAFGLVVTLAAIIGKLIGCGAAALPGGFNLRGAYRIGLGMMPRGEVALIVAGIGLSRNLIGRDVFGVSILMTLLTTILAPVLLVPAFSKGGSGRKRPMQPAKRLPSISQGPALVMHVPGDLQRIVLGRILKAAEESGWDVAYEEENQSIFLLRSRGDAAQVRLEDGRLCIDASDSRQQEFADFVRAAQQSLANDAAGLRTYAEEKTGHE